MAPMFLVSDVKMVLEATKAGITGAIPALNYQTDKEFRNALAQLKEASHGPFGINLIANKSNFRLKEQLRSCIDYEVDFIITSLGNPKEIVERCRPKKILVVCDVIDEKFAEKAILARPDGLIAVNKEAGGHAGKLTSQELLGRLKKITEIPLISAGGVGKGDQLLNKLRQGACGVSIGSPFIATKESPVSEEYKMACVSYSAKDIVFTTKLSGTPCTVINTPYVQQTGTQQNALEMFLNKNRTLKKLAKSLAFYKGMQSLKRAAFSTTYKTVWCAGPSIEYVTEILPVKKLVSNIIDEYYHSLRR